MNNSGYAQKVWIIRTAIEWVFRKDNPERLDHSEIERVAFSKAQNIVGFASEHIPYDTLEESVTHKWKDGVYSRPGLSADQEAFIRELMDKYSYINYEE